MSVAENKIHDFFLKLAGGVDLLSSNQKGHPAGLWLLWQQSQVMFLFSVYSVGNSVGLSPSF